MVNKDYHNTPTTGIIKPFARRNVCESIVHAVTLSCSKNSRCLTTAPASHETQGGGIVFLLWFKTKRRDILGPFHGAIAVPSVTRCRCRRCCCRRGHRCARATVATPMGVRRLAVGNGPNIFQMLIVILCGLFTKKISDVIVADWLRLNSTGPFSA